MLLSLASLCFCELQLRMANGSAHALVWGSGECTPAPYCPVLLHPCTLALLHSCTLHLHLCILHSYTLTVLHSAHLHICICALCIPERAHPAPSLSLAGPGAERPGAGGWGHSTPRPLCYNLHLQL